MAGFEDSAVPIRGPGYAGAPAPAAGANCRVISASRPGSRMSST
jgi:hypothetical protein